MLEKQLKKNKMINNFTISTLGLFFLLITNLSAQIEGYVLDEENKPLIGANIVLLNSNIGTVVNEKGYFKINKVLTGNYKIKFSYIGYKNHIESIVCKSDSIITFNIILKKLIYKMRDVVITPSSYLFSDSDGSKYTFAAKELEDVPDPSNDIIRKMQSVAGVETDNFNARIGIRGSYFSDILYMVDGIEVYEPFHMKSPPGSPLQLEGLISIIGDEVVNNVDLLLGGFSAKYGNKNGGALKINTINPKSQNLSGNIFVSLMSAGIQLNKSFKNHSFLFSFRRGYFDFLVNLMGAETNVVPHYNDLFFKYNWEINKSNKLFLEYLGSNDNYKFENNSGVETSKLKENINYFWGGWEFIGTKSFTNKLVFFSSFLPSTMTWNESDITYFDKGSNKTDAINIGVRNDSYLNVSDWYGIEMGARVRYTENQFNYYRESNFDFLADSTNNVIEANKLYKGYLVNLYFNNKFRIINNVFFEGGIRYDYQSYFVDGNSQLSPRLALSFNLPFHSTLRFAYGTYYQPTDIANLYTYTEESRFKELKGTHYIVGIDNNILSNLFVRLEGYYKKMDPSSDFIISKNKIYNLENSYAKGIDLLIRYNIKNLAIVSTYSLSTARDVSTDEKEFFRVMDRKHRFSFALVHKMGTWSFGLNALYMTGYPYTSLIYEPIEINGKIMWKRVFGEYKMAREAPFHRVDLSINKEFRTNFGKIFLQFEIINLFNYKAINERKWSWKYDQEGNRFPYEDNSYTFPFVPSLGISWKF